MGACRPLPILASLIWALIPVNPALQLMRYWLMPSAPVASRCGPAQHSRRLKRQAPAASVHALDSSPAMIERARSAAAQEGVDVEFAVADMRDLGHLGSRRFDLALLLVGYNLDSHKNLPDVAVLLVSVALRDK